MLSLDKIVFENNLIELCFESGLWTELRLKAAGDINCVFKAPVIPFFLKVKSKQKAFQSTNFGEPGVQSGLRNINEGGFFPIDNVECKFVASRLIEHHTGKSLELDFQTGEYFFTLSYHLANGKAELEIELELQYNGNEELFLHELGFALPFLTTGGKNDSCFYEIYDVRNNSFNLRRPFGKKSEDMLEGRIPDREHRLTAMDNDIHHEISCILHNPQKGLSIALWGYSPDLEAMCYSYQEDSSSLSFSPVWWAFERLKKGHRVRCRRLVAGIYQGSWTKLLEEVRNLKISHQWQAPSVPDYLKGAFIYQLHGFIADAGGFKGWTRQIPEIRKLGVDILYLPPLAAPEAYLNNAPDDVASCYGSAEDFSAMVKCAHSYGMKVIVDMIAHHIFRHGKAAAIPEFVRKDENGDPLSYSIGSVLTETRNSAYRDFFIKACRNLISQFDIDGFRFDVAGFQLPNWDIENNAYPCPGMGVLGQTELFTIMKRELEPLKELIYLEEGMGVNGFRYVTHGFIHYLKMLKISDGSDTSKTEELLRRLPYIFTDKVLKERPGVLTMYHTKIHDTALLQSFGLALRDIDRAWTWLIFTAEGVPFITQGMERGYRKEIAALSAIRHRYYEFSHGKMCFGNLHSDNPLVLCFTREFALERSIVAINFSSCEQDFLIQTDFTFSSLCELFSSRGTSHTQKDCTVSIQLPPYGFCILKVDADETVVSQRSNEELYEHFGHNLEISSSNGLLQSSQNCLRMENCIRLENLPLPPLKLPGIAAQLDEGSFSGSDSILDFAGEDELSDLSWVSAEYSDRHWIPAFVPSTRLPYYCLSRISECHYIEDISRYELHALWSRSSRLRRGIAYFRKTFECADLPCSALIRLISPSIYDFDLAVANGGVREEHMKAVNPCRVWINGHELLVSGSWDFSPVDISTLLKKGSNLISVAAQRGNGGHGILAAVDLKYPDGHSEHLETDGTWMSFPGHAATAVVSENKGGSSVLFRFDSLDHTVLSDAKCKCIYEKLPDGRIAVNLELENLKSSAVLSWSVRLEGMKRCRLRMTNLDVEEELNRTFILRNSYSGALWPVLRTDEFTASDLFSFLFDDGTCRLAICSGESGERGIVWYEDGATVFTCVSSAGRMRIVIG